MSTRKEKNFENTFTISSVIPKTTIRAQLARNESNDRAAIDMQNNIKSDNSSRAGLCHTASFKIKAKVTII